MRPRLYCVSLAVLLLTCVMTTMSFAQDKSEANAGAATPKQESQAVPGAESPAQPTKVRSDSSWSFMSVLRGLMGLLTLIGIAWLLSENKGRVNWKLVASAVAAQVILGLFLIKLDVGFQFFAAISEGVVRLLDFTAQGSTFVFGNIVTGSDNNPALAFKALPTIIFFSCLMAVLYHLRVMHYLILFIARFMSRFLGVTGAEAMAMSANIFVGQTEAPLIVRRLLPTMTRSELMALMTGGFATVAGSVLAAYLTMLVAKGGADLGPHLLIASVMSAPAAFAIAKIILPETQASPTGADMSTKFVPAHGNVLDAAASGTSEGLKLWANVFAMLLAFTAMVELINWPLEAIGSSERLASFAFLQDLSLQKIFGWLFAPLAFLMGVEWGDASSFGSLMGMKVAVNEFLAYSDLADSVAAHNAGEEGAMSSRSLFMATYALCGFANFASIGIQIGGISPLAPERRGEIIALAFKAMIGGALASWMTASIAGMFF